MVTSPIIAGCALLQIPRTRSTGAAGDGDDDLPPPPPPTPTELMAILAEGQRTMAKALCTIVNRDGRGARQGPEPNQYRDFKDFLDANHRSSRRLKSPSKLMSG